MILLSIQNNTVTPHLNNKPCDKAYKFDNEEELKAFCNAYLVNPVAAVFAYYILNEERLA